MHPQYGASLSACTARSDSVTDDQEQAPVMIALRHTVRAAAVYGDATAHKSGGSCPGYVVRDTPPLYTRFNFATVMGFQTARKYLATFAHVHTLLL